MAGFLILLGVVAVVVVVGYALGWWRFGTGATATRPRRESARLVVSPDFVCPKDSCSVEIAFSTTTEASGASGRLSLSTPSGRSRDLATTLSGELSFAGDDPIFADGPGLYTFTFVASGLNRPDITLRDDVVLMLTRDHGLPFASAQRFAANSTDYERMTARDIVLLGEGDFGKGHRRFSFCEKTTALSGLSYDFGGEPGYSDALTINVFELQSGGLVATATLQPGQSMVVSPPILMAEGAAIEMTMSAYTGGVGSSANAFPIGSTVAWSVTARLDCL